MRLTVDEYSKQFKMSKEMVSSKLKQKKLNYIIEDGLTYIIVAQSSIPNEKKTETVVEKKAEVETEVEVEKKDEGKVEKKSTHTKQKTTVATVIALYQRENTQLKDKIMQLEMKIDKLIDDKEQMLRHERDKIEELYTKKDEQLKNILELVNAKMMLERQEHTIHDVQTLENKEADSKIVELKEYLKTLDIKTYQRKAIKKRFIAAYDSDIRILQKNGKLYLDFEKYDYSDLLSY
jgi:hypothetical protein